MNLGADPLRAQAAKFGFGDVLRVPMRVTASSVPAQLDAAQTAQSAIGQYGVRATPLQMAMVSAAIANKGVVMKPYLVKDTRSSNLDVIDQSQPEQLSQAVSPDVATALTRMMVNVVKSGTGTPGQIPGIEVAGKTGTAQHVKGVTYAWFTAFAPASDPQIAVAVVVEKNGNDGTDISGGKVAAPIARQVMEAVLKP
jgi:peptidoglycan glycosyltransferase